MSTIPAAPRVQDLCGQWRSGSVPVDTVRQLDEWTRGTLDQVSETLIKARSVEEQIAAQKGLRDLAAVWSGVHPTVTGSTLAQQVADITTQTSQALPGLIKNVSRVFDEGLPLAQATLPVEAFRQFPTGRTHSVVEHSGFLGLCRSAKEEPDMENRLVEVARKPASPDIMDGLRYVAAHSSQLLHAAVQASAPPVHSGGCG